MRKLQLPRPGVSVSMMAHAALLLALLGVWRLAPATVSPKRLPAGTANGLQRMLVYSMGGAPPSHAMLQSSAIRVPKAALAHKDRQTAPSVAMSTATSAGSGSSGASALGDGNISIALVRFHPRPAPDLSALPSGTAGDVILDATIDAQGRITQLKVAKGFGGAIDQTVIATVQQWTFAPATKDGVPVPSEQEILFHYERS